MRRTTPLSIVLLLFAGMASAQTQSPITAEQRTAANDAYQKQDWKAAADAYEKIAKAEEKNPTAQYRYGMALLNLKRGADAQKPLEAAMAITPNAVFALALARAYAQAGDREKVYTTLDGSTKFGGISAKLIDAENDFDKLRSEAKFAELVKKADGVANPCRARPEYRQFDFWIGEWAPQNPQGLTVGTSSIQLILNDCVIFENWNTPQGGGKSFSLWDARDGKWHQTWVDTRGGITHYAGGLEDNKMVLVAETISPTGQKGLTRMTYSKLADGSVRQHGEGSGDGGKTWATVYDFKYVRVK